MLSERSKEQFNDLGLAATIMLGLAFIIVVVGGIVVIAGNLSFHEYLRQLVLLAAAFGLLGVGREIRANGRKKKNGEG